MVGDMGGRIVKTIDKDDCIIRKWVDEGKMSKWMCWYDETHRWCESEDMFGRCRWRR